MQRLRQAMHRLSYGRGRHGAAIVQLAGDGQAVADPRRTMSTASQARLVAPGHDPAGPTRRSRVAPHVVRLG